MRLYKKSKQTKGRFTMIELLVVVSIIMMLAALLLPALNTAKQRGRTIQCANSLRQIGILTYNYSSDYDGYILGRLFPPDSNAAWWAWILFSDRQLWWKMDCPEVLKANDIPVVGYGMDYLFVTAMKLTKVAHPSQKGYIVDSERATTRWGLEVYPYLPPGAAHNRLTASRHNMVSNILFVDGHVSGERTFSIYLPFTSTAFKTLWDPTY